MMQNDTENIINTLLTNINSDSNNIFGIYGGIKSGKTYLLKKIRCQLFEERYSVLLFSNDDAISTEDYSVFLYAINETSMIQRAVKEGISDFFSSFSDSVGKLTNLLLNIDDYMLSHMFFNLNSIELEILKRIYSLSEKHKLVILADDIDKWEDKSIKLLSKIIELKYKSDIAAFNDLFVITTQTTDKNRLKFEQTIYFNIKNIDFDEFRYRIMNTSLAELPYTEQYNLYNLSEGNYGIIEDVINYSSSIIDYNLYDDINSKVKFEKLIKSILQSKLSIIDENKELSSSLGCASIIGKIFDERILRHLLEKNIYEIKIILNIAKNEHFIYEKRGVWKFTADYIYDYFLDFTSENRASIHYQLAEIFTRYLPSDLYNRYYHLKKSEQHEKAIDILTVHCIRSIIDLKYFNEKHINEISMNAANIDILKSISSAFKIIYKSENYIKARNIVIATDDYANEIVIIERDYALAFILYHCNELADFQEAENILIRIFQNTELDLYQWARCSTLLFLLYANRLNNHQKARVIEKEIVYRLAKAEKIDEKLKVLSNIMQRVSPSLYNTDVSYLKTRKSYNFFSDNKELYPKEYVMAATNYIAMCICSSKYIEAVEISKHTIQFVSENFTYDFPKIFKFFNNYILAKYFSKALPEYECCKEIDKIFRIKETFINNLLLQNNKAVFMAAYDLDKSYNMLKHLYENNKHIIHNDYYTYLFSINYMLTLILKGKYTEATQIFYELDYLIPTICKNDKTLIMKRYEAFLCILESKQKNILYCELKNIFCEHLSNILDDYWTHPFILSDCQYWSEF